MHFYILLIIYYKYIQVNIIYISLIAVLLIILTNVFIKF